MFELKITVPPIHSLAVNTYLSTWENWKVVFLLVYLHYIIHADGYLCIDPLWILSPPPSPDQHLRGFLEQTKSLSLLALRGCH